MASEKDKILQRFKDIAEKTENDRLEIEKQRLADEQKKKELWKSYHGGE